ncbi:MATE family efflux transporter [Angelakisella massiliensis]|uniref:MATE family efflux transporter n=1 Tax=Angelakisella massiliensis TaxID=1871018 RepID=UPI0008F86F28|nr:MATE family efflux transporter [Angelakisella massiliensis]
MVKDMTRGKPLGLILGFFFPMVLGNLFQQFYNMADTIIVGRFVGVQALAAVGSTGSINFLVIGFVTGICSGFSLPLAQSFGAGDMGSLRRGVAHSLYLGVIITVVLTAVTVWGTPMILTLMQTPVDIFQDAATYISIIFWGIGATMFYNMLAGILRALGDSRTPLYFLILSSLLNVGLDLLFILRFDLAVAGAAWATVISQGVSGLLCLVYIVLRFPILHLGRQDLRPERRSAVRLLSMGLPMALQFSITAVGSTIIQTAVNTLGSQVVAAVTAGNKVQNIVTQPMETIGITMATYCGQNLGAGRVDRIDHGIRLSLGLSLGYCVVAAVLTWFWGDAIALLFLDKSEVAILAYTQEFLRINALFYPVLGVLFLLRNSLQGMGFGVPAMAAGVFELAARSLVAFLLVGRFAFDAICMANPAAWIFADILLIPVSLYELRQLRMHFIPPEPSAPSPCETEKAG